MVINSVCVGSQTLIFLQELTRHPKMKKRKRKMKKKKRKEKLRVSWRERRKKVITHLNVEREKRVIYDKFRSEFWATWMLQRAAVSWRKQVKVTLRKWPPLVGSRWVHFRIVFSFPAACFANLPVDFASFHHFQTSLLFSLWQKKYMAPKRRGGCSSAGIPNTGARRGCL